MNPRVTKVSPTNNYCLNLVFSNGEKGIYNYSKLLDFGVFRDLKNPNYFHQVKVVDSTVAWPHEQDIYPDSLYLDSKKNANTKIES
jgi:hypothetical protein